MIWQIDYIIDLRIEINYKVILTILEMKFNIKMPTLMGSHILYRQRSI